MSSVFGFKQISIINFVEKFVKLLVLKKENQSIVTAFYSYVLEFEDREKELLLRSSEGGSIEPAITFLFKGGLIFESVLKHLYPVKDDGISCKTLGDILFHTRAFQSDFNVVIKTTANSLQEIVSCIGNDVQSAFNTTCKLRNTTGHNLVWDDVFGEANNFRKLYEQQINAIFYLIQKKFL